MASSSSSSRPRTWRYRVFTSFHGPDVRKTFITHLRKQFNCNGISMFDDEEGIERSQTIGPTLKQAITESRISIIVFSKNYASSSWCLDELVEIFRCKQDLGQIVMTVFHGVTPSDVRKQTGDFGSIFNKTCARKTKERRIWSQALTDAGNIAGEDFQNWDNESKMVDKISKDVSDKLNATISRDSEDLVGIEAHLQKLQSLLHLDYEGEAMFVGISGPLGIGKTTIARALHNRLSSSFQLTCFLENIGGSYNRGLDEYGLKLCLQERLLSKILNQNGLNNSHLGAIHERLCDQKVLIVLDNVDDLKQLEALANESNWFGPGSRIIVTMEDQEILEQHDIKITYQVGFPTEEEAWTIFCRYAFRQSSAPDGFEKYADRVSKLCSKLPLGLRLMGSSLRGKKENDWEDILHRLENSIGRDTEAVLRVGYENLHENDQSLFLLIAIFFNDKEEDHVMAVLADSNLDVKLGLKNLAYKSLIQISTHGKIVVHKLLQQVARQAVKRQAPSQRQILTDGHEICNVLEMGSGSESVNVMGISFDASTTLDGVHIHRTAFERMRNLQFLRVYKTKFDTEVHVPEDIVFPPHLRLLHWDLYPGKCLPHTFSPKYLVVLDMPYNDLEKLWDGTACLKNLKEMVLYASFKLKELPDLSEATNLESLNLNRCESLEKIPSSFENLHKLKDWKMEYCMNLQVVPTHFNLASLEKMDFMGCSGLKEFAYVSENIVELTIPDAMLKLLPKSIGRWSRLKTLLICGSIHTLTFLAGCFVEPGGADIETIPECIKDLRGLEMLYIYSCTKLKTVPELPGSLTSLHVEDCESLETVSLSCYSLYRSLKFPNCLKLDSDTRKLIIQNSMLTCLPGSEIPPEFTHTTTRNSLTIRSDFFMFKICVAVSPQLHVEAGNGFVLCHIRINGSPIEENFYLTVNDFRAGHLIICYTTEFVERGWFKRDSEITFKFTTTSHEVNIVGCGVSILMVGTNTSNYGAYESEQASENDDGNLSDGNYEYCCSEQGFEEDEEILSKESYDSCRSEQGSEDDDGNLSDGSYESCCSEQMSEDDDENSRRVKRLKKVSLCSI